jgi:hypothetical protein
MSKQFRPDPAEFERCVSHICLKMETIALSEGISHVDCSNLDAMLAAIPARARDSILAMLNDISLSAERDDRAMAFAARYVMRLAYDLWHSP